MIDRRYMVLPGEEGRGCTMGYTDQLNRTSKIWLLAYYPSIPTLKNNSRFFILLFTRKSIAQGRSLKDTLLTLGRTNLQSPSMEITRP